MNFANCQYFNLKQILESLKLDECASLKNQLETKITGFSSLAVAKKGQLSFWVEGRSVLELKNTEASFVLVPKDSSLMREWVEKQIKSGIEMSSHYIKVVDPYASIIEILLEAQKIHLQKFNLETKIHSRAKVHPSAVVEGVVHSGAVVGPNCFIASGSVVGEGSVLEAGVNVYANVTLGKRCILQSGCVIGSRGYGFRQSLESKALIPVPHLGGVVIADDVQIGANSVVASGFLEPTALGERSCLDSLIQIGHNVVLGGDCYMASQSGIAGSTVLGRGVQVAGGAQIAGHLKIGAGAVITAKAGVTHSIGAGAKVSGYPAMDHGLWKRLVVKFRSL
jgi:UDP-3-O-[3-hydroxymyristoyl] glucosamine N-acyltransferase